MVNLTNQGSMPGPQCIKGRFWAFTNNQGEYEIVGSENLNIVGFAKYIGIVL